MALFSEINRLEREINALEKELRQNRKRETAARRAMEENLKRKLENVQWEMERAVEKRDARMAAKYEEALRDLNKKMNEDLRLFMLKEDSKYRELVNHVEKAKTELDNKIAEQRRCIEEIKRSKIRKEKRADEEAAAYIEDTVASVAEVNVLPHETFRPNEFSIFVNSLDDAKNLRNAGLFEAAAAVAISTRGEVVRFGYEIIELRDEWHNAFNNLCERIMKLRQLLDEELKQWAIFSVKKANDAKQLATGINFWSRGSWGEIEKAVNAYKKKIEEAQTLGLGKYLKMEGHLNLQEIHDATSEICKHEITFKKTAIFYKNRYEKYLEREEWGEKIIDFLTEEINFKYLEGESSFGTPSEESLKTEDFLDYVKQEYEDERCESDVREPLLLVFESNDLVKIFVWIVPVENEKEFQMDNAIRVYVEGECPDNSCFNEDIRRQIAESLKIDEALEKVILIEQGELNSCLIDPTNFLHGFAKILKRDSQNFG